MFTSLSTACNRRQLGRDSDMLGGRDFTLPLAISDPFTFRKQLADPALCDDIGTANQSFRASSARKHASFAQKLSFTAYR
jgi:hypothetical protein